MCSELVKSRDLIRSDAGSRRDLGDEAQHLSGVCFEAVSEVVVVVHFESFLLEMGADRPSRTGPLPGLD